MFDSKCLMKRNNMFESLITAKMWTGNSSQSQSVVEEKILTKASNHVTRI